MTYPGIVFDLDGTLVDSSADIAAALNRTFRSRHVRALGAAEVSGMLGGGPRTLVQQAITAVAGPEDDDALDRLVEEYSAWYRADPVAQTVFLADAREAIHAMSARGVRLGVCTNKRTDIAERVLDHLGVRGCFGAVVGSDAARAAKPHPDHLLQTIEALGLAPADCLYVGDTAIDETTAAAAKVRYAHVAWGHPLARTGSPLGRFSDLLTTAADQSAAART